MISLNKSIEDIKKFQIKTFNIHKLVPSGRLVKTRLSLDTDIYYDNVHACHLYNTHCLLLVPRKYYFKILYKFLSGGFRNFSKSWRNASLALHLDWCLYHIQVLYYMQCGIRLERVISTRSRRVTHQCVVDDLNLLITSLSILKKYILVTYRSG